VKADCHINAIGSHTAEMQEIDISILADAKIIVDQKAAALAEAGEIITALKDQAIIEDDIVELGYVVNHPSHFEKYKTELTLFKSVGLAIQDLAIATLALELAEKNNIGTLVDF
jgi:ornithine cyclodeaminase